LAAARTPACLALPDHISDERRDKLSQSSLRIFGERARVAPTRFDGVRASVQGRPGRP
jgi:hypothetical protein